MPSALGLIRIVPDSELQHEEQQSRDDKLRAAREANERPVLQGLAKYVMDRWEDARQAKQSVLPRLQRARRARLGEYDPAKLAEIREFGGSEVYPRLVANKCRILEAWLRDVYLGQTEKPWTMDATPKPSYPPDAVEQVRQQVAAEVANVYAKTGQMPDQVVVQALLSSMTDALEERLREAARISTARMEKLMEDQMVEGGFAAAMGEFLADLVGYPAAILKAPVLRRRPRVTWVSSPEGIQEPQVIDEIVPEWDRLDPFRAYPAPGAATPQEGFFIEHETTSYQELTEYLGTPGVNEEALRAALNEAEEGGLSDWLGLVSDDDRPDPDNVSSRLKRKTFNIDVLIFHGPVKGTELVEWGIEDPVEDPDATYEACVWLIGEWVVKAHLNYDPLGLRPYFKSCYENLPGDFWGFGLSDILEDLESVVAAAARALVNNMSVASGPQVVVNVDRLPPGENITQMHPWKIWQTIESQFGSSAKAIDFFQPSANVGELLTVIDKFYALADDMSLVPRYLTGSEQAKGAGRTASGLSMLMDAAYKGLKGVVSGIDLYVMKPMLEKLYAHNMMFATDTTVKGDAQVVARGAVSLMRMEALQIRRNEFLQATANPIDSQIVGQAGRAEILREVAKGLEMDTSRIVPSREELEARSQMQAPMGAPGQGQPPAPGAGEQLQNGAPVTDTFSKNAMTPGAN
jgi:hypothetical protein